MGLGIMGHAMATNIARAGYPLLVFNHTPRDLGRLTDYNVRAASNAKALAEKSDVTIAMVTGPEAVENLLWGEDGAAQAFNGNKISINMSTVPPKHTKRL